MPSIVTGYIIKSYKGDVYPKSWDVQSSNDGVNCEVLDTSTTPLCAKFKENVEYNTRYCNGTQSYSKTFSNNRIFRFYKLRMIGGNTYGYIDGNYKYCFIFSSIEFYGRLFLHCNTIKNTIKISTLNLLTIICFSYKF